MLLQVSDDAIVDEGHLVGAILGWWGYIGRRGLLRHLGYHGLLLWLGRLLRSTSLWLGSSKRLWGLLLRLRLRRLLRGRGMLLWRKTGFDYASKYWSIDLFTDRKYKAKWYLTKQGSQLVVGWPSLESQNLSAIDQKIEGGQLWESH